METKQLLSKKIGYCLFGLMGMLCAFLWKAERDLAAQTNIVWTGNYILKILIFSFVVGGVLGSLICFLVYGLAEGRWTKSGKQKAGERENVGKCCFFSLILILLGWLPCYLAYYPGICSYDTTIQLAQILEGPFNDHHPIAHTLLLKGAMELGETLFGSVNTGIGVLVAIQMVFLAVAFSYGITQLYRLGLRRGWLLLLQLYCMIYPFHWYMSVSTIKDTWFSAFFLLQMVSLCALLLSKNSLPWCNRHGILFVIGTVGMIVFRNNGKYAMLVLLVLLLPVIWRGKKNRRLWVRIFAYSLAGIVAGSVCTSVLYRATDAQQGDRREMLSMPIQQLARCMIYHGGAGVLAEDDNTMDQEDKALIQDFLLNESYKEYRPDIADPVKQHTNTYVVRYRIKEFAATYLGLFAEYPGDYLNAALAVNAGYLSPGDVSHAVINVNGRDMGLGYVQTRWVENELNPAGIYKASLWESLHTWLEKWADDNAYLHLPVLKYLFVPGTYLWLYLLLTGCLLVNRRYKMLLPLALVLGYYITLFLGPTVQLRYIYPLMIVFPFLALSGAAEKFGNRDCIIVQND